MMYDSPVSLSIYVHIPHCLQQCPYCDFATLKNGEGISHSDYIHLVCEEIRTRSPAFSDRKIETLYFGGGTPSLYHPELINKVLATLKDSGFDLSSVKETTLEINPGTLTNERIDSWLKIGISRFSVGVQTFHDEHLNRLGRDHTSFDSHQTLKLLKTFGVNFTFDLMFALPYQTVDELRRDLDSALEYQPNHVSAYILTLPEKNPLNLHRPDDVMQSKMFYQVEAALESNGLKHYEISNYAIPGFESQHNQIYWSDRPYWGLGMSAHSYLPSPSWGRRFYNPPHIKAYQNQVHQVTGADFFDKLPAHQIENLQKYQSLTDYILTQLRTMKGLDLLALQHKFGLSTRAVVEKRLLDLQKKGSVYNVNESLWAISPSWRVLSEAVFEDMVFLKNDHLEEAKNV